MLEHATVAGEVAGIELQLVEGIGITRHRGSRGDSRPFEYLWLEECMLVREGIGQKRLDTRAVRIENWEENQQTWPA